MNRRFNFTGRRKIERQHAQITVSAPAEGAPTFSADIELAHYELPPEAAIYVEAHRHTSLMRFDWGTVADPGPRNGCELTEFGSGEGVRFRVKVVERVGDQLEGRPAQLLATADRLTPRRIVESVERAESLLPVESAEIEEIWRLDFDQDGTDGPILRVNRRLVTDRQALVRGREFATLVLPQVLRSILERITSSADGVELEGADDWRTLWLSMARRLPGVGPLPSLDEDHHDDLDDWINACIGAFSRSYRLGQSFGEWWSGEEAS